MLAARPRLVAQHQILWGLGLLAAAAVSCAAPGSSRTNVGAVSPSSTSPPLPVPSVKGTAAPHPEDDCFWNDPPTGGRVTTDQVSQDVSRLRMVTDVPYIWKRSR